MPSDLCTEELIEELLSKKKRSTLPNTSKFVKKSTQSPSESESASQSPMTEKNEEQTQHTNDDNQLNKSQTNSEESDKKMLEQPKTPEEFTNTNTHDYNSVGKYSTPAPFKQKTQELRKKEQQRRLHEQFEPKEYFDISKIDRKVEKNIVSKVKTALDVIHTMKETMQRQKVKHDTMIHDLKNKYESEIESLKNLVPFHERKANSFRQGLSHANLRLRSFEKELRALRAEISDKDSNINLLNKMLKEKSEQFDELQSRSLANESNLQEKIKILQADKSKLEQINHGLEENVNAERNMFIAEKKNWAKEIHLISTQYTEMSNALKQQQKKFSEQVAEISDIHYDEINTLKTKTLEITSRVSSLAEAFKESMIQQISTRDRLQSVIRTQNAVIQKSIQTPVLNLGNALHLAMNTHTHTNTHTNQTTNHTTNHTTDQPQSQSKKKEHTKNKKEGHSKKHTAKRRRSKSQIVE